MKVTIKGYQRIAFIKQDEIHTDDEQTVKEIIRGSDDYELLDYLGDVDARDMASILDTEIEEVIVEE